jgi:hypothetical protein
MVLPPERFLLLTSPSLPSGKSSKGIEGTETFYDEALANFSGRKTLSAF